MLLKEPSVRLLGLKDRLIGARLVRLLPAVGRSGPYLVRYIRSIIDPFLVGGDHNPIAEAEVIVPRPIAGSTRNGEGRHPLGLLERAWSPRGSLPAELLIFNVETCNPR